jgi:tRNA A-37 threonylcarbamoyl transferase component Bud32
MQEVRAIARCRQAGIPAPAIFFHDDLRIFMQLIGEAVSVKEFIKANPPGVGPTNF